MMWMDCYDRNGSGGLYMASYDSDFILTGIRSETGGGQMIPGVDLGSENTCPLGRERCGARTHTFLGGFIQAIGTGLLSNTDHGLRSI